MSNREPPPPSPWIDVEKNASQLPEFAVLVQLRDTVQSLTARLDAVEGKHAVTASNVNAMMGEGAEASQPKCPHCNDHRWQFRNRTTPICDGWCAPSGTFAREEIESDRFLDMHTRPCPHCFSSPAAAEKKCPECGGQKYQVCISDGLGREVWMAANPAYSKSSNITKGIITRDCPACTATPPAEQSAGVEECSCPSCGCRLTLGKVSV